jgi:uracil-DNA glycosylase family 4
MNSDNFWEEHQARLLTCCACERLTDWREKAAVDKRKAFREEMYWGKPVPGFGDVEGRVLIVGLAPGTHGANRTGRMFTGDSSGDFLFQALYKAGFANQPKSISRADGLRIDDIYISAVCRCAPPDNRPMREEINNCSPFLEAEIVHLPNIKVVVALGQIAFERVRVIYALPPEVKFYHGAVYESDNPSVTIIASYHPSRQNTQTKRLTIEMFDDIWELVKIKIHNRSNP